MWTFNEDGQHSHNAKYIKQGYSNNHRDLFDIGDDERWWEVMGRKWASENWGKWAEVVESAQKWRGVSELSDSRT